MLTNLADNVFLPNYETLVTATADFSGSDGSLAVYCDAIGGSNEAAAKTTAKTEWRSVMDAIQQTELHAIGPVAANANALRDRILSYSTGPLSSCGVDEIAALSEDADFDLSSRAGNQKGLGAVGYLLHDNDLEHSCSSLVSTTSDWNSKSESDRKTLRCSAALKIAQDVASAALSVRDQWVNSYRSDLVSESSAGDNLQAVSDAIFYYEKGIKDKKLGIPLGINAGCSALSCPAQVESQYSLSSLQSIRINSESFLKVFQGGSGLGFDDFIVHEGFPEVSTRFATNTNAVIDAVATIEVPLYEQATSINTEALETQCTNAYANPDTTDELSACTLYGLVKRISDDLKIDFVTIVNVDLPDGSQSDND